MTLSMSTDTYTEMIRVQASQIRALQDKIAELEAKLEVSETAKNLF